MDLQEQITVLARHDGSMREYLCFREVETGRYWVASIRSSQIKEMEAKGFQPRDEFLQLSTFIDTALDLLEPDAKRRTFSTLAEALGDINDQFPPSDQMSD